MAGYAFGDLAAATAVALSALWIVPMVALSGFALRRPDRAGRVLVVVTAVVLAGSLADALVGIVPCDELGALFLLAGALAHQPGHRGPAHPARPA